MERGSAPELRPIGRRAFLGVVAGGLSSIAWGPPVWRVARDALLPLAPVMPPPLGSLIRNGWRIYTVTGVPHVDARSYRLKVGGFVEHETELRLADLKRMPVTHVTRDFHCVTGWSVPKVRWTGVKLTDFLAAVRPLPGVQAIGFYSADGAYSDSLTLEQGRPDDVLLAWAMDGKPLTAPHGAPLRLVVPKMYGYKGVKWVNEIRVLNAPFDGFWEQRGYDRDAWVGHSNGHG
jgi:DMSO/TMAO reductase YedYZ molybdopterin-dependent catalytic subunit